MLTVDDSRSETGPIALDATEPAITPLNVAENELSGPTSPTKSDILRNAVFGPTDTKSESESESPISSLSEKPSKDSNKRWRKPRNVREFAAQANAVTTMVLNGEIDPEAARLFSSIARTVAQSMSIEVTRARFLKERPDLEFGEDVWEDPDDGDR